MPFSKLFGGRLALCADRPFFIGRLLLAGAVLTLSGLPLGAADPLRVSFTVEKALIQEGGKVTWVDGQAAQPGDLLRYQAVYANQGATALRELKAQIPLPAEVLGLAESARPVPTEASLDGAVFLPWAEVLAQVAAAQAQGQPLPVLRVIRWAVPQLPSGESFTASVEARVVPVP